MTVHRTAGSYATLVDRAHDHAPADPEGAVDHDSLDPATLAAYVADPESAAYTGDAGGTASVSAAANVAKLADLNALRVAVENLRAAVEDLRTTHA